MNFKLPEPCLKSRLMVYQKSPPQNFSRRTLNVPSLLTVLRESHTILSRVFLQHTVILEPVLLLLLSAYIENRQGANRVVIVTAKCSFSSSPYTMFWNEFLRGHFLWTKMLQWMHKRGNRNKELGCRAHPRITPKFLVTAKAQMSAIFGPNILDLFDLSPHGP